MSLSTFVNLIPTIADNTNYWIVRTASGVNYDYFLDNQLIAIEYNGIPSSLIKSIHTEIDLCDRHIAKRQARKNSLNALKPRRYTVVVKQINSSIKPFKQRKEAAIARVTNTIKAAYPGKKGVWTVYKQLEAFLCVFKTGDFIVIPDKDSRYLSIGRLVGSSAFNANTENSDFKYEKRWRVEWFKKDINRYSVDKEIYKLYGLVL